MPNRIRRLFRAIFAGVPNDSMLVAVTPTLPLRILFQRFWPYLRPYRRWFGLTLVFIALRPALEATTIWLFKLLVDQVLVPRDFAPFPRLAAAYVSLMLVGGIVTFVAEYLAAWVSGRFLLDLRTSVFKHLQRLSPDFFDARQLGDLISRLTSDVRAIDTLARSGLADTFKYLLRLVFFVGALVYLAWDLALISLVVAPFFWLVARYFARLIKEVSRERRRRSGSISAVAEESLANIALVQAYNREADAVARFHRENVGSFHARLAATRLKALFAPLINLIQLAGVLIVVGLGASKLVQGHMSLGDLLVFLTYLSQVYSPIRGLSRLTTTIFSASAGAERVVELLDQRPLVTDHPGARSIDRARGAITFEGVGFRYPAGTRSVLDEISFHVAPGDTVALVGVSGAGKSTLAKLLLRFYDSTSGRILLDNHDLREISLHALRAQVAVVLQETLILDGTIRDNIAFGRPDASDEEIVRAAQASDAHAFIAALPHGYATMVGQKGRRLSGGQRQRIAIARAMVRDAPILILDEPTTGLDAEASQRILAPLRRLMQGRTTVVISHNLLTVREATVILVLEGGTIVERGTHAELLRLEGTYAQLYRLHHPDHAVLVQTPERQNNTVRSV